MSADTKPWPVSLNFRFPVIAIAGEDSPDPNSLAATVHEGLDLVLVLGSGDFPAMQKAWPGC